jgi:hypothetical protein
MKRWFRLHWGSNSSKVSPAPSLNNATSSGGTTATPFPAFNPDLLSIPFAALPHKPSQSGPRHKQYEHVYSSLYWNAKIKALVSAQIEIDKAQFESLAVGKDDKAKQFAPVVTQQRVTRECWEAESDEVKAIVAAKHEELYQVDLAFWNQRNDDLEAPAKQQQ